VPKGLCWGGGRDGPAAKRRNPAPPAAEAAAAAAGGGGGGGKVKPDGAEKLWANALNGFFGPDGDGAPAAGTYRMGGWKAGRWGRGGGALPSALSVSSTSKSSSSSSQASHMGARAFVVGCFVNAAFWACMCAPTRQRCRGKAAGHRLCVCTTVKNPLWLSAQGAGFRGSRRGWRW